MQEITEAEEAGFRLGVTEVAKPVEGIGFFNDDEVFHSKKNVVSLCKCDGPGPPGESTAIDFAEVGAGKAAIDFLTQLRKVGLHAG